MSHLRYSLDFFPKYEPAGVKTKYLNESTGKCIHQPLQLPETPEAMKRFRRSHKNAVGSTITHYGKVNDLLPSQNFTYGKKVPLSGHVPEVMRDEALEGLKGYMKGLMESKYDSNQKEPLGQTINRGYKWPSETQNRNFAFGISTLQSESAKDVVYSHPGIHDDEKIRQLYVKSHRNYEAGEQIKRDYKWPVKPDQHVFGRSGKTIVNEAKMCLHPELQGESFPRTLLVHKSLEDFKDFAMSPMGTSKNLGQSNRIDYNHAHGYKPKNKEPWNAGQCIHGQPTYKEIAPDADLGKSTKFGFRNIVNPGDEQRMFGIPTIRNDLQKPNLQSVADTNNYGDEADMVEVLFPQRFYDFGVTRKDFELLRPKEEIRKLFANIGYGFKPGKFEGVWDRAQEIVGFHGDLVSINAFIEAIREFEHEK